MKGGGHFLKITLVVVLLFLICYKITKTAVLLFKCIIVAFMQCCQLFKKLAEQLQNYNVATKKPVVN